MTKTCLKCSAEKPLEDFYKFFDRWAGKHYLSTRCKPCHLAYKQNNPNRARNQKAEKLQLRYGLTYEAWETMREEQGYACMICGITEEQLGKRLDVDHCHNSGKARGLLCNPCNNMIGHARDNPDILAAGATYMRENADGYKGLI